MLTTLLLVITIVLAVALILTGICYLYVLYSKPSETELQLVRLKQMSTDWQIRHDELVFGRLLGKGSQGEVFEAQWRGTVVAVKKVDVRDVEKETIDEFVQEAEIMHQLRHPNIVLLMGVCLDNPHLSIVTEFVSRGSLFDIMRDPDCPLTWSKSLSIAKEVAQGCSYLHGIKPRPIIHRDLKSLNILIGSHWHAKVADFGMTRFQGENTMTQCGSPLWMAPEMIQNQKAYDEKVDVYSFGIVLWELYTRKVPFRSYELHPNQLVQKVVRDDLRPPIPQSCPEAYRRLIQLCWHPVPSRRPSMREVAVLLESFIQDPSIAGHIPMSDRTTVVANTQAADTAQEQSDAKETDEQSSWVINVSEIETNQLLRAGLSASVYEGKYRGKTVAVKKWRINTAAVSSMTEVAELVTRVMEQLSTLRHTNLVLFMGAFAGRNHVGVVEELMERDSLATLLQDEHAVFHWDTMIQFLLDCAQAMTYLHSRKPPIAHGDLKPSRLLVNNHWRVKVSGYGVVDFDRSIQSVQPSIWMAPEVLQDPSNGVLASNVYSFGMIMLYVLTRKLPFEGMAFDDDLVRDIVDENLRPQISPDIDKVFVDIMEATWHPAPSKRPTFQKILERLQFLKERGPTRTVLTPSNALYYRKRQTVFAYRSKDPVSIVKEWGKSSGSAGCYVLLSGEDDVYLCEGHVFNQTYERVEGGAEHEYRKTGTILAKQMHQPFALTSAQGNIEYGVTGDYLVQADNGDQWSIAGTNFPTLYQEVKDSGRSHHDTGVGLAEEDGTTRGSTRRRLRERGMPVTRPHTIQPPSEDEEKRQIV